MMPDPIVDVSAQEPDMTVEIAVTGQGEKGDPGYTPVRGVDYWTEEDQQQIVEDVLAQIGDVGGGSGEAWEYIGSVTAETDTSEISLTADSDGNGFELKRVMILVDQYPIVDEDSSSVNARVAFRKDHNPWYQGVIEVRGLKTTDTRGTRLIVAEAIAENIIPTTLMVSHNDGSVPTFLIGPGYYTINAYYDRLPVNSESINAVRFGSYQKAIGTGTTITVYGVRA